MSWVNKEMASKLVEAKALAAQETTVPEVPATDETVVETPVTTPETTPEPTDTATQTPVEEIAAQ
jgi:hypothetical protein